MKTTKGVLIVGLLVSLSACQGPRYYHPSKPSTSFNKDYYDCRVQVAQDGRMQGLDPFVYQLTEIPTCLEEKHGWTTVRPDNWVDAKGK